MPAPTTHPIGVVALTIPSVTRRPLPPKNVLATIVLEATDDPVTPHPTVSERALSFFAVLNIL